MNLSAELITTGNELLNGSRVNTHAQTLGQALLSIGLTLSRDTTVGDHRGHIAEALSSALRRSKLIFISGGLGSTSDDLTREALADTLGRNIITDPAALRAMQEKYARLNRSPSSVSNRQALVLEGAIPLPNRAGMAPGQRIDLADGQTLFVLPGPPDEFNAVWEDHVLPWIRQHIVSTVVPHIARFFTCGLGESDIAARLESIGLPKSGVEVGYCASVGQVEIRLAASPENASALQDAVASVRQTLGNTIFSETHPDLAEAVGLLLIHRAATVATAESCTGGLLGHRITQIPGSSTWYRGGLVAYHNDIKMRMLGVRPETLDTHGAVSEPTVREMAAGVRAQMQTTYAVATTGIAGPDGGTPEKPVGLVFMAVAGPEGIITAQRTFSGHRDRIKSSTAQAALDLLRKRLLDDTERP